MSQQILEIIEAFLASKSVLSRQELMAMVPLAKTSMTRCLLEMTKGGHLARVAHGKYRLGKKLAELRPNHSPTGFKVLYLARQSGFLAPSITGPMSEVLEAKGALFFAKSLDNSQQELEKVIAGYGNGVDGVIVFQHKPVRPQTVEWFKKRQLPIIQVGYPACAEVDTVSWNEWEGLFALTQALIDQGSNKIIYLDLSNYPNQPCFRRRWRQGVQSAAMESGVEIKYLRIQNEDWLSQEKSKKIIKTIVDLGAKNELGVIAINDVQIVTLVATLEKHGLSENISIAGVHSEGAQLEYPHFLKKLKSRLIIPTKEVGRLAAWRLLARLNGDDSPPICSMVAGQVISAKT